VESLTDNGRICFCDKMAGEIKNSILNSESFCYYIEDLCTYYILLSDKKFSVREISDI
jgi:hypothetical protein